MDDFWKFLKGVFYCVMFAPLVIGLLMIATGNGKSSNDSSSSPSYTPASTTPVTNYSRSDEQLRETMNSIPNDYTPINTKRVTSGAPTPDDAYSEGYDEGYEQGRRDGAMDIATAMDMMTLVASMTIMRPSIKRDMRRAIMMVIVLVNQSTKRNKMRRRIGSINFSSFGFRLRGWIWA